MLSRAENQNGLSAEEWLAYFDEPLRRALISFFQSRRMSPSDAEDLTHQVFMRVLEFLQKGREVSDLRAYAYGVARNIYLEELKRRKRAAQFSDLSRHEMVEAANVTDERLNPGPRLEEEELSQLKAASYQEALAELSPDERDFLLSYYPAVADARKIVKAREELAVRLGISETNMRVRLNRLRRRLTAAVLEKMRGKCGDWWE